MKWIKNSWYLLVAMELNFIAGLVVGSTPPENNVVLAAGVVWFALIGVWILSKYKKVW